MFVLTTHFDILIVLIYVDYLIVTCSNFSLITQLISSLHKEFTLKDLGPLHYFLGIEALRTSTGMFLTQSKYITDLLTRFGVQSSKSMPIPMSSTQTFSISDGTKLVDPTMYRSPVGALQYRTLTRPDINFVVNKLCKFMHSPSDVHWQAIKHLLRYLHGITHYGLFLKQSSSLPLTCYADADWACCPNDR